MSKQVILTGLRANNDLHIGNYLGALLPMVDMAKNKAGKYQVNLFVPDLHSFTTPIDHKALQEGIMQNLRVFVAAGLPLDNPDVHIYRQSYISAHSELTWILDCFTGFGEMSRMTQFKDKTKLGDIDRAEFEYMQAETSRINAMLDGVPAGKGIELEGEDARKATLDMSIRQNRLLGFYIAREEALRKVKVGLFNYPVLMAADILLYDASYVPVGDDQTQHLEFTRDIAERMNRQFGNLFTVPEPVAKQHEFFGKDQGLRIKDLLDPTKKMSKSDETGKGVIFLTDSPEVASKKIMGAATDSFGQIKYDVKERPGISNLLQMHALLAGETLQAVIEHHEGQTNYGDLKKEVAEQVAEFLTDFQAKLVNVDDTSIIAKLEKDEAAMGQQANATLLKVQRAVGLRP